MLGSDYSKLCEAEVVEVLSQSSNGGSYRYKLILCLGYLARWEWPLHLLY
jgi:hypothetical protein